MKNLKRVFTAAIIMLMVFLTAIVPGAVSENTDNPEMFLMEQDDASEYGYINTNWYDENGNEVDFDSLADNTNGFLIDLNGQLAKSRSFPVSYKATDSDAVTSVKNQGGFGTCWAFGTINACESSAIKQGFIEKDDADFSESHLVWNSYILPSNTEDMLYAEGYNKNNPYNVGGNWQIACSTLSELSGLNDESDFPYYSKYDGRTDVYNEFGKLSNDAKVSGNYNENSRYENNGIILKDAERLTSSEDVKAWIMDNGCCVASYYVDDNYRNNISYYYPENTTSNHMISVVGWDDNYSVENFDENNRPAQNGAWYCKNSWGERWGENGYFWLSYYDATVTDFAGFKVQKSDDIFDSYSYNGIYPNAMLSVSSGAKYSNVYTAKANEIIKAVSVYTFLKNTNLTVSVYALKNNYSTPVNGTLLKTITASFENEGYHQIDINDTIKIEKGSAFSVVVTLNNTQNLIPVAVDSGSASVRISDNNNSSYVCLSKSWNTLSACAECTGNTCVNVLTACDHRYDYSVLTAATCNDHGEEKGVCTQCGEIISRETEPIAHKNLYHIDAVESACNHMGNTEYYLCPDCGKYYTDAGCTNEVKYTDVSIPCKKHTFGDIYKVDGGDGTLIYRETCSECGMNRDTVTRKPTGKTITIDALIEMIFQNLILKLRTLFGRM